VSWHQALATCYDAVCALGGIRGGKKPRGGEEGVGRGVDEGVEIVEASFSDMEVAVGTRIVTGLASNSSTSSHPSPSSLLWERLRWLMYQNTIMPSSMRTITSAIPT